MTPSVPSDGFPKWQTEKWPKAFQGNLHLIRQAADSNVDLDVVFLGDSITEHWNGVSLGSTQKHLIPNKDVFQDLFNGTSLHGIALGVAADQCPNLLYQIDNGKFLEQLDPKIWWLLIGTNDFIHGNCASEEVVAGNINIVEKILAKKPNAHVVINSLLPIAELNRRPFP